MTDNIVNLKNGGTEAVPSVQLTLPAAKLELLAKAFGHPQGILMVPLEGFPSPMHTKALTDMVIASHLSLIDVCISAMMVQTPRGVQPANVPCRIFRLTEEGKRERMLLMIKS